MAEESWRTPMLVQEMAKKVQQPPSRYVQPEQYHPISLVDGTEPPESIPVINLTRLSAADGADEGIKLRLALQSWGLFLVANHEVETSLMDDLINMSREFFRQPLQEKEKCSNVIGGKHPQVEGYGNDLVKFEDQTLDWCDRLHLRVEPEDERNFSLWPKHPTPFRFNYYPPCPRPDLVFGIKPHSDAGVLTILLMDKDVGGLQILRDGKWHNVPTSPHRLLINLGDYTEIMSNGIFKSPVHRAVANAEKERISLAMFHGLHPEKEIEPAAILLHEKQPARYRKSKAKEYLAGYYEHFSRGTRFIDSVKM
ncbi:hypothetical protein PR202_gb17725 [Eleusine coracana subsp. coracana]|uniref:Fe2OG dioxygenase domain-containing protein n=1 Tax=Eleusine coracana subsp. coracana TaxID=191504 RepID=A0AAV5F1G7_ELECO|nr:hypothetical protein PR202_gb17725 [Eleusine coracana subsp. coracana]